LASASVLASALTGTDAASSRVLILRWVRRFLRRPVRALSPLRSDIAP
jgi:hypothetical protein